MRLSELVAPLPVGPPRGGDPEVRGVSHDSRRVGDGDLYVAIVGRRHDGRRYAAEAVERGAVAVLGPGPVPEGLGSPWVVADEPRALLGPLAARLYGHPDRGLLMAGVTGTNGKSTVVALLREVLEAAGYPCGALGTLGYRFGDHRFEGRRTTPEASDLFRILAAMRESGARAVSMEVSSHALAMGRVEGARFDVAVFTNLSREHLDMHGDLEGYFAAKRRLFEQLKDDGRSVIHLGDAFGKRLAAEAARPLTWGDGGDVTVRRAELSFEGIRAVLATPRGELTLRSSLLGRYNLANVTAAVAASEALRLPQPAIIEGIARLPPLAGRMEPVGRQGSLPVLIDYAHTPAALEAALRSLRELTDREVVLVFGCGGDRDRGKRPLMGRVAGELAEWPILTSDNPRGEDPSEILSEVETGLREAGHSAYRKVLDRRQAIRTAIEMAGEGRVVLVAGKGHETSQIVGDRELPFSDREELETALEARGG